MTVRTWKDSNIAINLSLEAEVRPHNRERDISFDRLFDAILEERAAEIRRSTETNPIANVEAKAKELEKKWLKQFKDAKVTQLEHICNDEGFLLTPTQWREKNEVKRTIPAFGHLRRSLYARYGAPDFDKILPPDFTIRIESDSLSTLVELAARWTADYLDADERAKKSKFQKLATKEITTIREALKNMNLHYIGDVVNHPGSKMLSRQEIYKLANTKFAGTPKWWPTFCWILTEGYKERGLVRDPLRVSPRHSSSIQPAQARVGSYIWTQSTDSSNEDLHLVLVTHTDDGLKGITVEYSEEENSNDYGVINHDSNPRPPVHTASINKDRLHTYLVHVQPIHMGTRPGREKERNCYGRPCQIPPVRVRSGPRRMEKRRPSVPHSGL